MATIDYSKKAQADLSGIFQFWADNCDPEQYASLVSALIRELEAVADNDLIKGQGVPDLPGNVRTWLLKDKTFRIYFIRKGPGHIRLLRVYHTSRRPIRPGEVR